MNGCMTVKNKTYTLLVPKNPAKKNSKTWWASLS